MINKEYETIYVKLLPRTMEDQLIDNDDDLKETLLSSICDMAVYADDLERFYCILKDLNSFDVCYVNYATTRGIQLKVPKEVERSIKRK